MTIDSFYEKYNGKKVCNGGLCQCVALVRQYLDDVLQIPQFPQIEGAYQIPDVIQGFEKVSDPRKGDIVVWEKEYSGNGHTGIFWEGDKDSFVSFDQNHGGNQEESQLVRHNGFNIKGFLRPKGDEVNHEVIAETVRKVRKMVLSGTFDSAGAEADIRRVESELNKGNKYAFEQLFKDYEKAKNYRCSDTTCSHLQVDITNMRKDLKIIKNASAKY
jgi:hypothetical protein